VVGLLAPLVLAAILSVVAVAAARAGRASSVPGPPGPVEVIPRGLRVTGRWPVGLAIAAATVVGLLAAVSQGERHPGGDPGGRILGDLELAGAAIPPDAVVISRDERDAKWVSCEGAPGSGWTDIGVSIRFSTSRSRNQLGDRISGQLSDRGWQLDTPVADAAGGPQARWSRPLAGAAGGREWAQLASTDRAGVWRLDTGAPPEGDQFPDNC